MTGDFFLLFIILAINEKMNPFLKKNLKLNSKFFKSGYYGFQ